MYMHVYIHVHIDKQDAYTYMHSTCKKNFPFPCSFYTVIFLRVLEKDDEHTLADRNNKNQ